MYRTQKNTPKDLQNTDKRRMFASSYILTSGHSSLSPRAFFVPGKICGVTPSYSCNGCTACWSSVGQRVGNSLCFVVTPTNLLSVMSYTDSKGLSGKHSTVQTTRALRKRVSHEKFTAEKDAKNRAYAFILSRGLLRDFARFSACTSGAESHAFILHLLSNLCKK